ncbi:class I SAM-dependent methyltransferase [Asanoa sp. WMMD1127]|uniref:class I SAM-dependent methyltransferase n=1 Tax=Asanoa sp. WMMD1127 TaxID=3016107 RepID=UPI00241706E5|nr:class I SAM-dependent methyltransferase [Asanoa sp. WMMD1127]MDG4824601.1 class I SAM-dependent methyltransferase [Asanoa sp. WMMD1127]
MAGHRNLPTFFMGHPSRFYDFMARRVFRRMYRRIAADVDATAPRGARVLDVGTGPGILLLELARLRPDLDLTGIDLSPDMVATAGRHLAPFGDRARVRTADVTDLPFPDGSFDLIVSSLSLHHWDHPEAAAPELTRTLRPGGRIQIYDMPFAPFSALDRAGAAQRDRFRTGIPILRGFTRFVVQAPGSRSASTRRA